MRSPVAKVTKALDTTPHSEAYFGKRVTLSAVCVARVHVLIRETVSQEAWESICDLVRRVQSLQIPATYYLGKVHNLRQPCCAVVPPTAADRLTFPYRPRRLVS